MFGISANKFANYLLRETKPLRPFGGQETILLEFNNKKIHNLDKRFYENRFRLLLEAKLKNDKATLLLNSLDKNLVQILNSCSNFRETMGCDITYKPTDSKYTYYLKYERLDVL